MVIFSQCMDCKHYTGKNNNGEYCCEAFPNGISDEVFWNKISHKESINGDNNITFEEITD